MTGGERVFQSLQQLVSGWDGVLVRAGGRTVRLSELDDERLVARQVVAFLVSRHLPETPENPDEVSGSG